MAKEVVQKMCVQNNQPNYSMNNQDEKNKYISNLYELIDLGGQPKRTMKIIRLYMHLVTGSRTAYTQVLSASSTKLIGSEQSSTWL